MQDAKFLFLRFRGTKTQEIIAETPITLSSEIITLSTDEEDMMILTTSSKQSTLCLPRHSSKICNILWKLMKRNLFEN